MALALVYYTSIKLALSEKATSVPEKYINKDFDYELKLNVEIKMTAN